MAFGFWTRQANILLRRQSYPEPIHHMGSWWSSTEAVSTASTVARWAGALLAIVILVLGNRTSALQARDRKVIQDETDLKVSNNERETAVAKSDAASANARAEEARLEAEKLKMSLAWRDISADRHAEFKKIAGPIPKGPILVNSISGDPEAANFARKISEMLADSGYAVTNNFGSLVLFGPPLIGVTLEVRSGELPAHAVPLQQALGKIGIHAPGGAKSDAAGENVIIIVGSKP